VSRYDYRPLIPLKALPHSLTRIVHPP
jgi:hypothetical protein